MVRPTVVVYDYVCLRFPRTLFSQVRAVGQIVCCFLGTYCFVSNLPCFLSKSWPNEGRKTTRTQLTLVVVERTESNVPKPPPRPTPPLRLTPRLRNRGELIHCYVLPLTVYNTRLRIDKQHHTTTDDRKTTTRITTSSSIDTASTTTTINLQLAANTTVSHDCIIHRHHQSTTPLCTYPTFHHILRPSAYTTDRLNLCFICRRCSQGGWSWSSETRA